MTMYSWYILAFAAFTLAVSYWVTGPTGRRRKLLLAARVALLLAVLGYPWDFFAIRLGAWTHPNFTGLRLYGVPVNDSLFTWLFSYLACVVLLRFDRRKPDGNTKAQRKRADDQNSIHQRA
jgi:lycopene cyclase domain-containing protein